YEDVTDGRLPGPGFVSRLRTLAGVQLPRPAATPVELPVAGRAGPAGPPPRPVAPDRDRRVPGPGRAGRRGDRDRALPVWPQGPRRGRPGSVPDYPYAPPGIVVSPDGQWLYVTLNFRQLDSEGWKWRGALVAVDAQTRVTSVPFWFAPGAGHGVITP